MIRKFMRTLIVEVTFSDEGDGEGTEWSGLNEATDREVAKEEQSVPLSQWFKNIDYVVIDDRMEEMK
jgi:hypothetical protein